MGEAQVCSTESRRSLPLSHSWNWVNKVKAEVTEPTRLLGIRREDRIEGLLLLNLSPEASRVFPQGRNSLLYVEYLEAAPWNRPPYAGEDAKYSGVGCGLLYGAAHISLAGGQGGALGLHSLPEAIDFYKRVGLTDLGADEAEGGLHYMELSRKLLSCSQELSNEDS